MRKRNWLVEDNLVALYVALYDCKDLEYNIEEIGKIITHKKFGMRSDNYKAIFTDGKKGLNAGLKSPTYNELYNLFVSFGQVQFARLVNLILKVKKEINEYNKEKIMATLPTPEDRGKKILAIFKQLGIEAGQSLIFGKILSYVAKNTISEEDLNIGLSWLEEKGYVEKKKDGISLFIVLTEKGYAAM